MSDFACASGIADAWPESVPRPCIEVVDCIESTQAELRRRGAPACGTLLLARSQTAGRGQRGRSWLSAPGAGIYLSLAWRLQRSMAELGGLSLALGAGLAETLRAAGFAGVAVKWPNDLVVGEAKLAGLLVEFGDGAPGCAVVGLGLNLCLPVDAAEQLQRPVTDLSSLAPLPGIDALAATAGASLLSTLIAFDREGFGPWRDRWSGLDALEGQRLQIVRGGQPRLIGVAAGIGEDGALLLRDGSNLHRLHSGEASVLPA